MAVGPLSLQELGLLKEVGGAQGATGEGLPEEGGWGRNYLGFGNLREGTRKYRHTRQRNKKRT